MAILSGKRLGPYEIFSALLAYYLGTHWPNGGNASCDQLA